MQRGGGCGGKKSRRPVKEDMNKNKKRMGEKAKKENRDGRREGDEGAAQKETTGEAKRRKKVGTVPRTGTSEARKKSQSNGPPWTRISTSGGMQWQAEKRTEPRLEHPGKKEPAGNRPTGLDYPGPEKRQTATGPPGLELPGGRRGKQTSTRSPDWNIRGGRYRLATGPPGLDRPGGRSPGRGQPETKRLALERGVKGSAKRKRRQQQEKREASQGEHEQEQGTQGRGDKKQEP